MYILKTVRVNGRLCANVEHLSVLADALRVRVEFEKAWGFWVGRCEKIQGRYALQMHALKSLCDILTRALSLTKRIEQCRKTLQFCPPLSDLNWADESQIQRTIASCRLTLASDAKQRAVKEIRSNEDRLMSLAPKSNTHSITGKLLAAIRNRDIDEFTRCSRTIQDLEDERQRVQKLEKEVT
jgi:hypothetical protein